MGARALRAGLAAASLLLWAAAPAPASAPEAAPLPAPRGDLTAALAPSDLPEAPPAPDPSAAPEPPAPKPEVASAAPQPPAAKPAPPVTAETLDWESGVRSALDAAPAPPAPAETPEAPAALDPVHAPAIAPKPRFRPARVTWSGPAALACKDARLAGEAVAPISDEGACGIEKPVRVTAVSGVGLSSPIYVGCPAARALADWLDVTRASAPDLVGAELTSIAPFASYACRNRNGRSGGKLSEHARGRAVDVGRFGLSDGRTITVKEGWRDPKTSGFLKRAWRNACKRFGTVLGPGSDIHHQDHFHLDVAAHRSGAYCR